MGCCFWPDLAMTSRRLSWLCVVALALGACSWSTTEDPDVTQRGLPPINITPDDELPSAEVVETPPLSFEEVSRSGWKRTKG